MWPEPVTTPWLYLKDGLKRSITVKQYSFSSILYESSRKSNTFWGACGVDIRGFDCQSVQQQNKSRIGKLLRPVFSEEKD
jgi:hypothetical protein